MIDFTKTAPNKDTDALPPSNNHLSCRLLRLLRSTLDTPIHNHLRCIGDVSIFGYVGWVVKAWWEVWYFTLVEEGGGDHGNYDGAGACAEPLVDCQ